MYVLIYIFLLTPSISDPATVARPLNTLTDNTYKNIQLSLCGPPK